MAKQHSATPEQWALVRRRAHHPEFSTILELRDRVEALEAAAKPNHPAKPDSSLVERVAAAITGDGDEPINWKPEARAAIREVAAWLREENPSLGGNSSAFASLLEREAEHRST